jgi:hypothetical protein
VSLAILIQLVLALAKLHLHELQLLLHDGSFLIVLVASQLQLILLDSQLFKSLVQSFNQLLRVHVGIQLPLLSPKFLVTTELTYLALQRLNALLKLKVLFLKLLLLRLKSSLFNIESAISIRQLRLGLSQLLLQVAELLSKLVDLLVGLACDFLLLSEQRCFL